MRNTTIAILILALLALSACSYFKAAGGIEDLCHKGEPYRSVSQCGDYTRIEYNNLGGGITWMDKNGKEIRCPVVGPDSMSAECKTLLENPPTCTKTVVCPQNPDNGTLVGNDRDAHGCIGSAGYSWCDAKQKCIRPWEEPCETQTGFTACPTEKPDGPVACTLEWMPVCGKIILNMGDTVYQTFGNKCGACTAMKVIGYTQGECPIPNYVECNHAIARGEMCTTNYNPVCAQKDNGIRCIRAPCPSTDNVTYSNGCEACKDEKVYGYVPGACANDTA